MHNYYNIFKFRMKRNRILILFQLIPCSGNHYQTFSLLLSSIFLCIIEIILYIQSLYKHFPLALDSLIQRFKVIFSSKTFLLLLFLFNLFWLLYRKHQLHMCWCCMCHPSFPLSSLYFALHLCILGETLKSVYQITNSNFVVVTVFLMAF